MENQAVRINATQLDLFRKPVRKPQINLPQQRGGEPVRVGELVDEFSKVFQHPNRNKVLADMLKRYW